MLRRTENRIKIEVGTGTGTGAAVDINNVHEGTRVASLNSNAWDGLVYWRLWESHLAGMDSGAYSVILYFGER